MPYSTLTRMKWISSQKSLDSSNEVDFELEPTKKCAWKLDMSVLEALEQDNPIIHIELDPRTKCIWEFELVALEVLRQNSVIDVTGDLCIMKM